jgi:hypothetical protein
LEKFLSDGKLYNEKLLINLDNLEYEFLFRIAFNEKTVTVYKADILRGSKKSAIGLHINLAKAFGFPSDDLDNITKKIK